MNNMAWSDMETRPGRNGQWHLYGWPAIQSLFNDSDFRAPRFTDWSS